MNTPEEAVSVVISLLLIRNRELPFPFAKLMSRVEDPTLFGIGLATPASTVIQILLCALYFLLLQRRQGCEKA